MRSVTVSPVAGLPGDFWVALFHGCHALGQGTVAQYAWPDGLSMLEQEELTVDAFQVIKGEVIKIMSEQRRARG